MTSKKNGKGAKKPAAAKPAAPNKTTQPAAEQRTAKPAKAAAPTPAKASPAPKPSTANATPTGNARPTTPPPQAAVHAATTAPAATPARSFQDVAPPRPTPAAPTREQIAERAFAIWLSRGRGPGHDVEDWLQAERELRS